MTGVWLTAEGAHARPAAAATALAARAPGALLAAFVAERERWVLWLPVLFGIGIAAYFGLDGEPSLSAAAVPPSAGFALALLGRRHSWCLILGVAVGTVGLGALAATWRTELVAAPVLERKLGPVAVRGTVAAVELREHGARVTLIDPRVDRLPPPLTPERLTITLPQVVDGLAPGASLSTRAVLMPPPRPDAPGAFDFARRAYFDRLGAVGYVRGRVAVTPADGRGGDIAIRIGALRQAVAERVRAGLEGPPGAIAAALMAGDRGAIPEDVLAALRNSGLAHLLAISGLHMGLVAGLAFFFVRAGLALFEGVALRHPIKKWAALAALAASLGYLVLTGATIPTQRAFLMITLVLLAVLVDRAAVSMRLVAWAAAAVLLLAPESLLSASFQMSFAAVMALVAAYEVLGARFAGWRAGAGKPRRILLYLAGVAVTTLVAGAATAPFAIYHFGRQVDYGLLANLLAVPAMALWIMPCALFAFVLMPFGAEALALAPMGWGIEAVIAIARWVAALPGAVRLLPAMPEAGLALVALGGLWLCLWRRPWRLAGLPAIVGGLATLALATPPDVLVDGEAKLFAVRDDGGRLALSSPQAARHAGETWLRRAGQAAGARWPRAPERGDGTLRCDPLGCLYRRQGQVVALVRDGRALAEDCAAADVVVSLVPTRRRCRGPRLVIDRFDLWRRGAHAIWLDGDGAVRVESVAERRGQRPWSRPPVRSK